MCLTEPNRYGGTRPNLRSFYPVIVPQGPFTANYKGAPRSDSAPNLARFLSRELVVGDYESPEGIVPKPAFALSAKRTFQRLGVETSRFAFHEVENGGTPYETGSDFGDCDYDWPPEIEEVTSEETFVPNNCFWYDSFLAGDPPAS